MSTAGLTRDEFYLRQLVRFINAQMDLPGAKSMALLLTNMAYPPNEDWQADADAEREGMAQ